MGLLNVCQMMKAGFLVLDVPLYHANVILMHVFILNNVTMMLFTSLALLSCSEFWFRQNQDY